MKNIPNLRFKRSRRTKSTRAPSLPVLLAQQGGAYCAHYQPGSPTCLRCLENQEGPFRPCYEPKIK